VFHDIRFVVTAQCFGRTDGFCVNGSDQPDGTAAGRTSSRHHVYCPGQQQMNMKNIYTELLKDVATSIW